MAKIKGKKKITKKPKTKKDTKKVTTRKTKIKNGEVFTPVWNVWISGKQLDWDKKNLITSITVKTTVDGSDTAILNISDPDFIFVEDNIYKEANRIKVTMGWAGYKSRVKFEGYISHVDMSFPEDGIPKLTLTCMDKTYRMDRKDKSKTYKRTTSAKVVRKICKKYGFKCKIQKGYKFPKQESITQSNQSDIAFIQQLAQNEVYPFTARLVGKTFYYEKKGKLAKKAKISLVYKEYPHDIISFEPKINKVSKEQSSSGSTNTGSKSANNSRISDHYTGKPSVGTSGSKNKGSSTSGTSKNSGSGKTKKYDRNSRSWK